MNFMSLPPGLKFYTVRLYFFLTATCPLTAVCIETLLPRSLASSYNCILILSADKRWWWWWWWRYGWPRRDMTLLLYVLHSLDIWVRIVAFLSQATRSRAYTQLQCLKCFRKSPASIVFTLSRTLIYFTSRDKDINPKYCLHSRLP